MQNLIILWETHQIIETGEVDSDGDKITKVEYQRNCECYPMNDIIKVETEWEKIRIYFDNGDLTEIKGHFEIFFR